MNHHQSVRVQIRLNILLGKGYIIAGETSRNFVLKELKSQNLLETLKAFLNH